MKELLDKTLITCIFNQYFDLNVDLMDLETVSENVYSLKIDGRSFLIIVSEESIDIISQL